MSSPHHRIPPAPVGSRAACACVRGDACSSFAPGHALHLMQARLATATPLGWTDVVVEATDERSGEVRLRTLAGGEAVVLWNASGAAAALEPGLPVALHRRYDVLSIGSRSFNCARVPTA